MEQQHAPSLLTLADMIAAGNYMEVDSRFIEKNVKVLPEQYTVNGTRLFFIDGRKTTDEVVAMIRAEGYEPAGTARLLAYGATFPDAQREHLIVALGAFAPIGGFQHVPMLRGDATERSLELYWSSPDGWWTPAACFLAVHRSIFFDADAIVC